MSGLYEEMKRVNEAALDAELLARQHPDNLSKSLEAAEHFKRLAELSRQRAGDDARSEEKRLLDATMAEYFQAQSHKSISWHAYQKRECDAALDELAKVTRHLNNAICEAEGILESLSVDGKGFLTPQLQQWRVSLAGCPAMEYTIRARKAETAGKFVEALDWYRHSVEEAQKAIEMGSDVPPTVNPAANRIMRGNMYSTVANSYKAMAQIMTDQAAKNGGSLGDDEGVQLLLCFLEAHRAGSIASAENPEWQQIGMATRSFRGAIEQFLVDNKERWGAIYNRFRRNGTLESIMHELDPERYAMATGPTSPSSRPPRPDVVLVTVNDHETRAVLDAFRAETGHESAAVPIEDKVYHDLGEVNGTRVFHAISEMGAGGVGGMQQTVDKAIRHLEPGSVIALGIAFGVDEEKQKIGDVLLSKMLRLYELQRVGKKKIVLRGASPDASSRLVGHFRGFAQTKWKGGFKAGVMLTGEKLIDNVDYRKQLQAFESEAIGGEMEGAGLYVSSNDGKVDWVVLKAICDFADGNKGKDKEERQKLAAASAARFFIEALHYAPLKRLRPAEIVLVNPPRPQ